MEPFESYLPRDLHRLRALRRDLAGWLDRTGVPPEKRDAIVLAVHEAAANAIQHAGSRVTVRGARDEDKVIVVVSNSGRWSGGKVEAEIDRGRGLTIMRGLMSHLDVSRMPDQTTIRMRLDLDAGDEDERGSGDDPARIAC